MLKIAMIGLDGGIKQFHQRITRDGEKLKLRRLYELVQGCKKPTEEEQLMLAGKLQQPPWMLWN
jgi:hypothetical protein